MADKTKKYNRALFITLYFVLVVTLLLLLTVSSYAWFNRSKTTRISNVNTYVTTVAGLEIALTPDAEIWGKQLSFLEMVSETAPLRPVTWSDKDQRFYAAVYGFDGRLTGSWQPLSDERNANRDNYEGYYCVGTFYARTTDPVSVSLTPAVDVEEGTNGAGTYLVGTPLWDPEEIKHYNGGQGAENAVRIGIKVTRLGDDNLPTNEAPLFLIYEPNCDTHADGSTGYIPTPSIDGTDSLVPADRLITQTASVWEETYPVEKDVQIYTFGEFTSFTQLFEMEANSKVKIQFYIWLEGQDVDCTNAIQEAQILANIQFVANTESGGSGLVPIYPSDNEKEASEAS